MSNAITKTQDIKSLINSDSMREQFSRALPKHLDAERFCRIAITATTRTPKLMDCTPASVMKCLLDLSAMGLEPDGRRAHLIPYENRKEGYIECQLIVDFKGIAELVMRSGLVSFIHADKVCEGDIFEVDCGEIKKHVIDYLKPRGKAYAYYALVHFKDGGKKSEVMTRDEVESIRKRSRAGTSGPWVTDFDEMAKKTVFRRCSKWLQLSPEIRDALEKDDDRIDERAMRNATPRPGFAAALAAPAAEPTAQEAFEAELAQEEEA